ncbi:MAG: AAA family ATPase [Ginsengibacter sp.]
MNKPLLLVITGMPASGKTTLAHLVAEKTHCPLLSRDELKEGYINTMGIPHAQLNDTTARHIYDTFFAAIELLLSQKISLVIEAAFQHKLWKPKLSSLQSIADIKILICTTKPEIAVSRFEKRYLQESSREKYHGDESGLKKITNDLFYNYYPIQSNFPTLVIDTTDNYNPAMEEMVAFIHQQQ